jgi:hypothetical protein
MSLGIERDCKVEGRECKNNIKGERQVEICALNKKDFFESKLKDWSLRS